MQLKKISFSTDSFGYLTSFNDWNKTIAIEIAKLEGFTLYDIHWEIIYFTRKFYKKFNTFPTVRTILYAIQQKYGKEKGNSRYLFKLFPNGNIIQKIAKISGLPKPIKCL